MRRPIGSIDSLTGGPEVARNELLPLVAEDLLDVERLFRRHLASPVGIVSEIGEFVAEGGGKRIRPSLLLLCTKLCNYRGPHATLLGTVVELIHCATLIHDDIIDDAETRRGRPAANRRWGSDVTVLFGDYMFAKAMELALGAESLRVMSKLADVTLRMTEGEMLQTRYVGRLDLTVDEYLDLVERKTAALFACCCELAGILADVGPEREQALGRYGRHTGMAFQLVDDLLDLTGDDETLGKPAARDLREGKATLAVLDLLAGGTDADREMVGRIIGGGGRADAGALASLNERLHDSGAIDRARERARFHAASAIGELDLFDDGPVRRAMRRLPELLLARDH